MKRKVKVSTERSVNTYSYLRIACQHALELANKSEEGRLYNCMTAMLFSAFCIEAYLNHLGNQKVDYWHVLKKKLSPEEKLNIISKIIGCEVDYGKRPFQSFTEIFRFRNMLVHAESEYLTVEEEQSLSPDEFPKLPQGKWESEVNLAKAKRFVEDTETLLTKLHMLSGERLPFGSLGMSIGSIDQIE